MIFDRPTRFAEAVASQKARLLLPNDLSAEELGKIDSSIRERALALARVANATFLQRARDVAAAIVSGQMTEDAGRRRLLELRGEIEGGLPEGAKGSMQDLFSDQRLGLVIRMLVEQSFGFGQWRQGQARPVLDAFPCSEFYRAAWRKEPRDWPARWSAAGGRFFPGRSNYPEGRMIARKDDPIWEAISAFGLPYAPFDYNSGMDLKDVPAKEAAALGVMKVGDRVEEQHRDFEDDFAASGDQFSDDLREALLEELGPEYTFDEGLLQRANERPLFLANRSAILELANSNRIARIGRRPNNNAIVMA